MWKKTIIENIKKATLMTVAAMSISISTPSANADEFSELETAYQNNEIWAIEEIKAFKKIINSPDGIQLMIETAIEEDMPIEEVFAEIAEFNKKYAKEQEEISRSNVIIPLNH